MAFIHKSYYLSTPMKAFLFLMKTLRLSQKEAQRLIDRGRLKVNGSVIKDKAAVIQGDLSILLFEPVAQGVKPLLQMPDFAIFDKPSGMLVHPNKHDSTETLLDEARVRFGRHSNTVHRLDRETSGLVVVSKNKESESRLKVLFEERKVQKTYLALVRGEINEERLINAPILKNSGYDRIKLKVLIDSRGVPSQTRIIPLWQTAGNTFLRVEPLTGRQHQIRAHLDHIGHPVLGDPIYGQPFEIAERYLEKKMDRNERIRFTGANRVMLHAESLRFETLQRFFIVSRMKFEKSCREWSERS